MITDADVYEFRTCKPETCSDGYCGSCSRCGCVEQAVEQADEQEREPQPTIAEQLERSAKLRARMGWNWGAK